MSLKQDKKEEVDYGEEILSWEVPEYEKHARSRGWYAAAVILALLLLLYSYLTANFLFAAIIIVAALVIILHDGREPEKVLITFTEAGVIVGEQFYDFDDFKDFSIIYKPRQTVKNIYFEFRNIFKPRLSIPLEDINPLELREVLLRFLKEDKERVNPPLSETLSKMFKL